MVAGWESAQVGRLLVGGRGTVGIGRALALEL